MRVLVLGAGGIVGQHMRRCVPEGVEAHFSRRTKSPGYRAYDVTKKVDRLLYEVNPHVVVNLAGENKVDVVEQTPHIYDAINTAAPAQVSHWCDVNHKHLVHVSTQGVFDGQKSPYLPKSSPSPITEYGMQKAEAEFLVSLRDNWTIARLTFVIGVRLEQIGRKNPLEAIFDGTATKQVNDRWFSPVYAADAAVVLWQLAEEKRKQEIVHVGEPISISRADLATRALSVMGNPYVVDTASDDEFSGPPRPLDTTWADGSLYMTTLDDAIEESWKEWKTNGH